MEADEKEGLTGGLQNLKQESIGAACRALVKKHCGESASKTFKQAYDIRSKMLHVGEPPIGTDLAAVIRELDSLVRHLLVRHVSNLIGST